MTENAEDFVYLVEAKGGVVNALEYGMRSTDLAPGEGRLADAWLRLERAWREHMQPAISAYEQVVRDLGLDG